MKIQCNTLLEAPLINLIQLYKSLNTSGVCGIISDGSKFNVKETSIGSLALLSYCNELEVVEAFSSNLVLIDIELKKGGIRYSDIVEASEGVLAMPSNLQDTAFTMASSDIKFKLLIGKTSSEHQLLEQDLYNYCTDMMSSDQVFTPIPMPLLSKKPLQFKIEREEGMSTISCDDLSDSVLQDLINTVKSI